MHRSWKGWQAMQDLCVCECGTLAGSVCAALHARHTGEEAGCTGGAARALCCMRASQGGG